MLIAYTYIIYVMGVGQAYYFDSLQACNNARFEQIASYSSQRVSIMAMPCVPYYK